MLKRLGTWFRWTMARRFGQYHEYDETRNGRRIAWKGYYWRGCTYIVWRHEDA